MNRSKIEYVDHTFNPITGCRHGCQYCYARTMTARFAGNVKINLAAKDNYRTVKARDGSGDIYILDEPMKNETGNALVYPFMFEPTLHRYRLDRLDRLKMGNNVFVGAMADVFGNWVPNRWIDEVMDACRKHPLNNYLFLTKNPRRYTEYRVYADENMWYGTSITRESEMWRFNLLPAECHIFVSLEPILEDLLPEQHNILFQQVEWIIIGAETGTRKSKVVPDSEWIRKIVQLADDCGKPVFMKDSLIAIVGEENMRRDYPGPLQKKNLSPKMREKMYCSCNSCGKYGKKNEMIALSARSARGEQPKQFAFMCKQCFEKSCRELGVAIPEFENWEDNNGRDNKLRNY